MRRKITKADWVDLVGAGASREGEWHHTKAPPIPIERALYEVAKPMRDALGWWLTQELQQRAYWLVAVAWNAHIEAQISPSARAAFSFRGQPADLGDRLLRQLIRRKAQLFPFDDRRIEAVGLTGMLPVLTVDEAGLQRGELPALGQIWPGAPSWPAATRTKAKQLPRRPANPRRRLHS